MDGEQTSADYITPSDVAQLLGISTKTVLRLAQRDPSMPCLRLGGVVRFHRERLMKWLRDQEQGQATRRRTTTPMRSAVESGG